MDKDYLSLISSLLQVPRCDVQFAVSFLARVGAKSSKAHLEAGKEVAVYLYDTRSGTPPIKIQASVTFQ